MSTIVCFFTFFLGFINENSTLFLPKISAIHHFQQKKNGNTSNIFFNKINFSTIFNKSASRNLKLGIEK